jgi:hypothetical protein
MTVKQKIAGSYLVSVTYLQLGALWVPGEGGIPEIGKEPRKVMHM